MQSRSKLPVYDDARFEFRHRRSPKSDSCGFAQLSKRATLFVIRDPLNGLNGAKRLNVLNDLNQPRRHAPAAAPPDADGEAGRKKPIQQDSLPTRQSLAGSSCTLRRSGAAAGEIMNLIIACAASRSFETVSRPTLFGQGMFTDPGTGPTKSVPGAPTMMLVC
jgi:hypothetical protein